MAAAMALTLPGDDALQAVPVITQAPENRTDHANPPARHQFDGRPRLAEPAAENTLPTDPVTASSSPLPQISLKPVPVATPSTDPFGIESIDVETRALLSLPVKGRITSRFGNRFHPILRVWKLHTGLDWAAPCGTPVGAAAPGTVTKVGWAGGNGRQVRIDHGTIAGHHVVTTYNHLSAVGVKVGQEVQVHQGVGRVGNTGYSTGCHLHFEVIADGWFTNPEAWLDGNPADIDITGMQDLPMTSPTPTLEPSAEPTETVTEGSEEPTENPSEQPTEDPSATPTPTDQPSQSPTAEPSGQPTASPTPCVTESTPGDGESSPPGDDEEEGEDCATTEPEPSGEPTQTPTGTDSPSPSPSASESTPGPEDSTSPTASTSPSASLSASATPSSTGTLTASTTPTATPSGDPTDGPEPTTVPEATSTN